jgi:hypothetical protein
MVLVGQQHVTGLVNPALVVDDQDDRTPVGEAIDGI